MSSNVIPKEKLSAYQRWELASFGEDRDVRTRSTEEIERENAQQLAALRQQAQQQGYQEGVARGQADGLQAARQQVAQEVQHLRQLMQQFGGEVERIDNQVAAELLDLALDFSKAMLKTALNVRPELVLPVVSEAIRYLPSVQQPALLVLNPADAALVKEHMADELGQGGWRVTEDPHLTRGGCRVETATNQVDATPQVRWQRIAEALGKQTDWLE